MKTFANISTDHIFTPYQWWSRPRTGGSRGGINLSVRIYFPASFNPWLTFIASGSLFRRQIWYLALLGWRERSGCVCLTVDGIAQYVIKSKRVLPPFIREGSSLCYNNTEGLPWPASLLRLGSYSYSVFRFSSTISLTFPTLCIT